MLKLKICYKVLNEIVQNVMYYQIKKYQLKNLLFFLELI